MKLWTFISIQINKAPEITYEGWGIDEIAKRSLPVNVTVEIGQPILKYTSGQSLGNILIEYVISNPWIEPLSFSAIIIGLISSVLTICSAVFNRNCIKKGQEK